MVIWALVAAAAVFWGLRLWVNPARVPPAAVLAVDGAGGGNDWSRLLGAALAPQAAPQPAAAARFVLTGIMATQPQASAQGAAGVALIAVDGKPPRAYRVGDALDTAWVLQSVSLRAAEIGPSGGALGLRLELPLVAPPATGSLPVGLAINTPVRPPPAPMSSNAMAVMPPVAPSALAPAPGNPPATDDGAPPPGREN
jgi:general secretion pathway protein C